jgi:hypothetical protein
MLTAKPASALLLDMLKQELLLQQVPKQANCPGF